MNFDWRFCFAAAIITLMVADRVLWLAAVNPTVTYNVLVLMVDRSLKNRFDLVHIGPAIDIAQKKCRTEYQIELNLTKGNYSHQCNKTASLGKTVDVLLATTDIVALIGPACSDDVQVVGYLAAYYGIPLMTGLGDAIIDDRSHYHTLIRTSYDLRDKARAILEFMRHHDWSQFGLIYRSQDIYYTTLVEQLEYAIRTWYDQKFVCNCKESYDRDQNKRTNQSDLEAIMDKMRSCARIIVIIGGEKEVRSMMLIAYHYNMTKGDYAFLYTELIEREAIGNTSWAGGNEPPEVKEKLKLAYQAMLIVSLNQPPGESYISLSDQVKELALREYNYTYNEQVVNYFTASFHDSVLILCESLRESQRLDPNFTSRPIEYIRKKILGHMKNVTFLGVSGNVTIDAEGDRIADYALLDQTDPDSGLFEVVVRYYGATKTYEIVKPIHWPNGKKPRDRPLCDFDGSLCRRVTFWEATILVLASVIFFMVLLGIFLLKRIKYKFALANMSWKIRWDEIEQINVEKSTSNFGHSSIDSHLANANFQESIVTGYYKTNQVIIKKLRANKLDLTKEILVELKIMRETSHDNLTRFIGICTENPVAIITEYCSKGSLRELLANDSLNLDWIFRCSIINDIIAGMSHLHNSEHIFHGRLNSNNCLIDSRFCVKISDFGLRKLRNETGYYYCCNSVPNLSESVTNLHQKMGSTGTGTGPGRKCPGGCLADLDDKVLYYAPEQFFPCKCKKTQVDMYCLKINSGSQKADVYSFGIILQEIILRKEPFYPFNHPSTELLETIKSIKFKNLRPSVPVEACVPELYSLMVSCWSANPDDRPDFYLIKSEMKILNKTIGPANSPVYSVNSTLTENLLIRMEQYATDLEMIVKQRTEQLAEEKKKTEELLYQILPKPVADQLKRGKIFEPNFFDSVSIFFSDIVGFTHLCSNSTPMQVVDFLNDLYTFFDSIISDYDVYKVETIGDSYMVVSGLPEKNGIEHARQICRMALKILELLPTFVIKHQPEEKLKLRIGINTGPCCAGCVGNIRPRFCLFGDAVNTASRMESNGEPLKIHVSSSTKSVLDLFGTFILVPRGEIFIKGKGKMLTYWLNAENRENRIN